MEKASSRPANRPGTASGVRVGVTRQPGRPPSALDATDEHHAEGDRKKAVHGIHGNYPDGSSTSNRNYPKDSGTKQRQHNTLRT